MSQLFDIDKEMSWYAHDTDPAIVNQAKAKRAWRDRDKPIPKRLTPVHQYSREGKLIASFKSTDEAATAAGCERERICHAARNEGRYTASGYYWSYQIKELIVKK